LENRNASRSASLWKPVVGRIVGNTSLETFFEVMNYEPNFPVLEYESARAHVSSKCGIIRAERKETRMEILSFEL